MTLFQDLANSVIDQYERYHNNVKIGNKDGIMLLEYEIGCAIFRLPKKNEKELLWTGFSSVESLKPGVKRSKDHIYPRKIGAYKLFHTDWTKIEDSGKYVKDLYYNELGRYNFVTQTENKRLVKYQKRSVFTTWEEAYSKVGIQLVEEIK